MSLLRGVSRSHSKRKGYAEIPDAEETSGQNFDIQDVYNDTRDVQMIRFTLQKIGVLILLVTILAVGLIFIGVLLHEKGEDYVFSLPSG